MSEIISFRVPRKYVADTDMETHDTVEMEWVPNKNLGAYYADTRFTKHMNVKNLRMTVRKVVSREPVRTSYIPQPGEQFVFISAARMS